MKRHEIMFNSIEQEKSALETEMMQLKDQILLLNGKLYIILCNR